MKFLIAVLAVACVSAYAQQDVPIIKSDYEIGPEGNYHYAYETGNGIFAESSGVLRVGPNTDYPGIEMKGSYRYTSPEGEKVEITYVANEDGYQPQGSHIPTAPPVPEYVLRAIKYIEDHPPPRS